MSIEELAGSRSRAMLLLHVCFWGRSTHHSLCLLSKCIDELQVVHGAA